MQTQTTNIPPHVQETHAIAADVTAIRAMMYTLSRQMEALTDKLNDISIAIVNAATATQPAAATQHTPATAPTAAPEAAPAAPRHWCNEHQVAFIKREKGSQVWYSHPTQTGWCREKPAKAH